MIDSIPHAFFVLLLPPLLISFIAWVGHVVISYSRDHDAGIDEPVEENFRLKEHIVHLEQDLEKYRRMEA